ncbi:endocytic protein [Trichoderma aethiopicum]
MSAAAGVAPSVPNLNLRDDERAFYDRLFSQASRDGEKVTGDVAVQLFEKTTLDSTTLGTIWQIADIGNQGFLTREGFYVALRLVGHAQVGKQPSPELALQPLPRGRLPEFAGIPPPQVQPPIVPQVSGGNIIPPLVPDKGKLYVSLFEAQHLHNKLLPGEQARTIFGKSGLPNEILGRIWSLADTEQRGALALPEFIIAMHLITSFKAGELRTLPNVLPAGLYEVAIRIASAAAPRQSPANTGGISAIPRQLSGSAQQQRTGSPLNRPPMVAAQATGVAVPNNDWAITPADKARFDQIYLDFDKTNKGYITGEEAAPFLSQSGLPEDVLAQIWDLADFHSQGQLTREGFAIAMYLIRQQRSNRGIPLPATLPPNLVPPSLRTQSRPTTAVSSAFDTPPVAAHVAPAAVPAPAPPAPKSALDDLFGLDSSTPSPAPPAPAQTTMSTGGSNADPFAGGTGALHPASPSAKPSSPVGVTFRPFVPSSSFGRGLAGHPGAEQARPHTASEDLLGDTDPEANKAISNETTELANLSNQISSLAKQTQEVQAKRTTTQHELSQTNSQKQNFEQRLAQLRQQYEKEAQDTHALEEKLRNSRADTKKLQGECMNLEGQLRDIQGQHQQVLAALQADQQENANLRERIRRANAEVAELKPQLEKLKLDARQQKGLVAINKKQLSTTEGERDKLKAEAEALARSAEDISRQAETGSPVSTSAHMASPALSTSSGNNPFFKRSASTDIMGVFGPPLGPPPPSRAFSDRSFDDLFGPAGPVSSSGTPPPVAAFRQQNTGQSSVSVGSFSNNSGPTPHVSRVTTLSAEPPAPPESRQLSSSFLPFPEHNESLSSSRQVSPPTSSRAEGSASGSYPFPGGASSGEAEAGAPAATASSEEEEKHDSASATPVPAAQGDSSQKPAEGEAQDRSGSFDNTDHAKAKADFDNAFAAFTSTKAPGSGADKESAAVKPQSAFDNAFDTEFPPISEIERDVSESDSEAGGFDDDFAPASPENKAKEKQAASEPTPESHKPTTETSDSAAPVPPSQDVTASHEGEAKSAELSSSPATITNNNTISQTSNADDIFGSSTQPAPGHQNQHPASKGAFDDLDDEFEGLEDAKEGSADDDFANISRSGLDDYNPMFDSSPPASQAKSESTAFGNESSFDFISSNSAASATGQSSNGQQRGAEAHDWDAIFSTLDSPTVPAAQPVQSNNTGPPKEESADARPPAPGRALTEAGEHDDPILKNLTSMGYSRPDALAALEKYDYNLERAANFLASQS